MKKIIILASLILLSGCAKPAETVMPEDISGPSTMENLESGEALYRMYSALTFSVPSKGYTMISGSTEGKSSVKITNDHSDLTLTLTLVTDLSQMEGMEDFELKPLSVSQLLRDYSTGSPAENCEARFVDQGGECEMADDIVEVVLLEDRNHSSVDEYLVAEYPYGKGNGVAGLTHIFESIDLDPTDLELASAVSVDF